MHTAGPHRTNCLVQLQLGPCHNLEKSECCFLGRGLAQREPNCKLGSPEKTSKEWTAILMQEETDSHWSRQTTQISCE